MTTDLLMNTCICSAESVRVIIESVETHPVCEHGPAILFERHTSGKCQRFYACSAYRDQKDCSLHIQVDQSELETFNRDLSVKNAENSVKLACEKSHLLRKVNGICKQLH